MRDSSIRLDSYSLKTDIFEFNRQVINAARGLSDPVGKLAGFGDEAHQRIHGFVVFFRREPCERLPFSIFFGNKLSVRIYKEPDKVRDLAMKSDERQLEAEW